MTKHDEEIWERILAGSPRAWAELVRKYKGLVYSVIARVGLSGADSADCFQQTWVALFESRFRVKDPNYLGGWLATTARREAIRISKKAGLETDDSQIQSKPDPSPLPDEELERMERQVYFESALNDIDKRCATLLRALFYEPESRSYEEIANEIGLSVNSLGPIRIRCLKKLRIALEKLGFIDVRK